jgi:hypothetical protein
MRRTVRKDAGTAEKTLREFAHRRAGLFQIPNRFRESLETCALLLQTVVAFIDSQRTEGGRPQGLKIVSGFFFVFVTLLAERFHHANEYTGTADDAAV